MQEILLNVQESLPYILGGCATTVAAVLLAMGLGFACGLPLAVLQVYGPAWCKRLVGGYVWFFRGVPLLILLFLFYYVFFLTLIKVDIQPFLAACITLGLTSAAYQSQIFRGAMEAIPLGQMKAAKALGMSTFQGIKSIVLPQALRLALPGWSNEYSIILKDTALVYLIGSTDIMARVTQTADRTRSYFTFYLVAAVLYLIITVIGLKLLRHIEKKVRIPGYNL